MATGADVSVLRPDLVQLQAYHVPPAAGMVKLDAMENPFSLPPSLQQALGSLLSTAAINRYPDPTAAELTAVLREVFAIEPQWQVLLGNGSDEIIQLLIQAVAQPGASVLALEPSFVMYRLTAIYNRVRYVGVPLTADFELDAAALLAQIAEHRPALTLISYPNNPTGNLFDRQVLEQVIAAAAPGLVVMDEAYQAFASDSFLPRLHQFANVLVMRTVSKLGLAGLRLGYLVGAPTWLHEIDKLRLPYNINVLTQLAATAILREHALLDEQTAILREERQFMARQLQRIPGLTAYASQANFILTRVPDAPHLHQRLKSCGILVKNLHGAHPLLQHCLRLTVGSPHENALLLKALQDYLS